MITWLQTFFLKHNKWLFSALLIVIIVTFVLTIGNQSFFGGRSGLAEGERREYYGYDLNNRADQEQIMRNAEISAMLYPELGIQGPAVQQYALVRVAALGLANDMGVPSPDSDQVRSYLESLSVFQSPESEDFDAERYNQYREFIATRLPEGERSLARVLREDYRIARVREALAGPGYIVPELVEDEFAQRETQWQLELAQRPYSDFQPELEPTDEELRAFYEQDPGRFEVPERIRVSAVRFNAENFLDTVAEQPAEEDLQAYFNRYRFRYQPRPEEGSEEAPQEVTLDEVRDRVVADFRREQARLRAQEASENFLTTLYEEGIARDSEAFQSLVNESQAQVESVPPYSRNNPPRQGGIPQDILRSMWIYTTGDRYYSDLAPTPNGAVLLIFDEVSPARIPPFDEIAGDVREAWEAETRRERFAQAANEWEQQIREAVANGTPFAEAAEAAGFSVETPEPFLGKEAPSELYQLQLIDQLDDLEANEIAPVVVSSNAAATAHVVEKSAPEVNRDGEEFTAFLEQELEGRQRSNGWAALNAWTERTLAVVTPEPPIQE